MIEHLINTCSRLIATQSHTVIGRPHHWPSLAFFLISWTANAISSRFFLPRLWVPRRFLANFNARFCVAAEPILISSIILRSYGAKPATSRITSRIMPTRSDLWPLRWLGLTGSALFVTICPLLSPAAYPVFSAPILSTTVAGYALLSCDQFLRSVEPE